MVQGSYTFDTYQFAKAMTLRYYDYKIQEGTHEQSFISHRSWPEL